MGFIHGIIQWFAGPVVAANQVWSSIDHTIDAYVSKIIGPAVHTFASCGCGGHPHSIALALVGIVYLIFMYVPGTVFAYSVFHFIFGVKKRNAILLGIGYKLLSIYVNVSIIGEPSPLHFINIVQSKPLEAINTFFYLYNHNPVELGGVVFLLGTFIILAYIVFYIVLFGFWLITTPSNSPMFTNQQGATPRGTMKRWAGWLVLMWSVFTFVQGDAGVGLISTWMMFFYLISRRSEMVSKVASQTGKVTKKTVDTGRKVGSKAKSKLKSKDSTVRKTRHD